jgi:hypothetical protein
MKVALSFVPPGGGEVDYEAEFDLPGLPQHGDYIKIADPQEPGFSCDFVVRRVWWGLQPSTDQNQPGTLRKLVVECEFALSGNSSKSHRRACDGYRRSARPLQEFEDSCY